MEVRLCEKLLLTINEASELSGIGLHKLRELVKNPECDFVIMIGTKHMIKRKKFEEFLENAIYI